MTPQPGDIDTCKLAAVLYGPEDDVDALLADFAVAAARRGERIGGLVQRTVEVGANLSPAMQLVDLLTGRIIGISLPRGRNATGCRLDPAGLAEAASAVTRAIEEGVALVIVNKFSKQEAAGQGLRNEIALAVGASIPVLTAVPEKCLDAWGTFAGGQSTTLACEHGAIAAWWAKLSVA
ncbi:MAG TPA: DUF2478 domain-containing protein [Hyphomicrobiaceae bacterium]|nr:DUF2478 domain-containing protein [Hyphomicrobiaceae bacterium]